MDKIAFKILHRLFRVYERYFCLQLSPFCMYPNRTRNYTKQYSALPRGDKHHFTLYRFHSLLPHYKIVFFSKAILYAAGLFASFAVDVCEYAEIPFIYIYIYGADSRIQSAVIFTRIGKWQCWRRIKRHILRFAMLLHMWDNLVI